MADWNLRLTDEDIATVSGFDRSCGDHDYGREPAFEGHPSDSAFGDGAGYNSGDFFVPYWWLVGTSSYRHAYLVWRYCAASKPRKGPYHSFKQRELRAEAYADFQSQQAADNYWRNLGEDALDAAIGAAGVISTVGSLGQLASASPQLQRIAGRAGQAAAQAYTKIGDAAVKISGKLPGGGRATPSFEQLTWRYGSHIKNIPGSYKPGQTFQGPKVTSTRYEISHTAKSVKVTVPDLAKAKIKQYGEQKSTYSEIQSQAQKYLRGAQSNKVLADYTYSPEAMKSYGTRPTYYNYSPQPVGGG